MDPREQKQRLKNAIRERILRLTPTERAAEGRSLSRRILQALPPDPIVLCAYMPLKDEIDIKLFLEEALKREDKLFLPCYNQGQLVFRQALNLTDFVTGTFQIPEPPRQNPILKHEDIDIAIVPGRAFARGGERLGRGNGGYDKWIRAVRQVNKKAQFWGVGFECQLTQEVPMEAHDERIDAIINQRGMIKAINNPV